MKSARKFYIFISVFFILALVKAAFGFDLPKWFPFSSERSLGEWQNKIFKGKVIYKVEKERSDGYLRALSLGSASAIFYKIRERFKAEDYPMISWKWKVVKFPDKEKLKLRQGVERDDYAARVYVIFPSINFMNSRVLEYVWDETQPMENISISPYSKNIKLIVVQTGADKKGDWVQEERNIFEDYKKAFGAKPRLRVGAIALMSDADNTQDVSEAYFDDIRVGYK